MALLMLDLLNLDDFTCRGHFALQSYHFVRIEGSNLHVAIRQNHDTARADHYIDDVQIRRPSGSYLGPLLQVLVIGGAPPSGRVAWIDQRGEAASRFRLYQSKFGPFRLPFGPKPFRNDPLAVEGAAARRSRVIDCAAIVARAMRAPHTHRLGNFIDRGHLAAQCAGAACSTGHQVAAWQLSCLRQRACRKLNQ